MFAMTACSGSSDPAPPPVQASVLAAAAASINTPVEVPASLASTPFDTSRSLLIPPGFGIRVLARVPNARFMALAPNGDILVSVPDAGKIVLLRDHGNNMVDQFDFATGLRLPQGMVFRMIGDTVYLYIAESNRVSRSIYTLNATQIGTRQIVVDGLPDATTPGLGSVYSHQLKNIAIGPDNKLYVSIASSCNACVEDTQSNPVRGAIYQYNADGQNGRLFARGIRNAEGLDFLPGTNTLWMAVNNRDQIKVPTAVDVDGDGTTDLGKSIPSYVDNNPPEPFTSVIDGANYGWPFCNAVPNPAMSNPELQPDFDNNPGGTVFNCATAQRPAKIIQAHSAPLGFSFLHNSSVPPAYRSGAAVALHGCWNCTTLKAGYKVIYFPFDSNGNPGAEMDLVTGFVTDPVARAEWGRPVDVIADAKGNLLISDDQAGAIYQLYPK